MSGRDHRFHPLTVTDVIAETDDARSFVFDVPSSLESTFTYRPGQFCSFKVIVNGDELVRSYSMSSTPASGEPLQVTVKRVPGGRVSNWLIEHIHPGDVLLATAPGGLFVLPERLPAASPIVAFAAGSGITPIWSIVKHRLAATTGMVGLMYANRDAGSVIFADGLEALQRRHPDRLTVTHHLDRDRGFVVAETVQAFTAAFGARHDDSQFFVCGPAPFMLIVEAALRRAGVDGAQICIERFTAGDDIPPTAVSGVDEMTVTVELNRKKRSGAAKAGTTLLNAARQLGLSPPFSCEAGNCATCMARLIEGNVRMRANNALTSDEVEDGWVLTCQAVPTTPTVHIRYE